MAFWSFHLPLIQHFVRRHKKSSISITTTIEEFSVTNLDYPVMDLNLGRGHGIFENFNIAITTSGEGYTPGCR